MEFNNEKKLKPPPRQFQLEYNLSDVEQDLSSQAQWYVYYQQDIPKRKFEDTYLNIMMIFQADVGGDMKRQPPPQLTKQMIPEYVK